jgi:two-component system sensor histidine kinase BarA
MSEKIIDWMLADQLANGDHEFAVEMIDSLIECIPEFQQNLKKAFERHDDDALKKVAHKLHGAACYTGTPRLKLAAKRLELEEGNIKAAYDDLIKVLEEILNFKKEA